MKEVNPVATKRNEEFESRDLQTTRNLNQEFK